MRIARGVAGFLIGYVAVVLLTTLGFGLLPPSEERDTIPEYLAAGAVGVAAGLAGGALGAWIGGARLAGALIAIPLFAETIWLTFFRTGRTEWLDGLGGLTLIAAVLVGAHLSRFRHRAPAALH